MSRAVGEGCCRRVDAYVVGQIDGAYGVSSWFILPAPAVYMLTPAQP